MHATIVIEIEASDLFEDENVNWRYCASPDTFNTSCRPAVTFGKAATFAHTEACEFILHVGSEGVDSDEFKDRVDDMREFGCTDEFIKAYTDAAKLGATRVLFYA